VKKEYSAGIVVYRNEHAGSREQRLYLLLQYPGGYWDLAKGKLEQDETAHEAALRELQEETGLQARVEAGFMKNLIYKFRDSQGLLVDKTVTFFLGEAATGEVVLSFEHKDFVWLPYEAAKKQLTYLNAQQLILDAELFLNKE